jgi:hypothetical protein
LQIGVVSRLARQILQIFQRAPYQQFARRGRARQLLDGVVQFEHHRMRQAAHLRNRLSARRASHQVVAAKPIISSAASATAGTATLCRRTSFAARYRTVAGRASTGRPSR